MRIQKHLSYANVVSTLALFIALGAGTAFATGQLAPRSVGAKQLRPGAVIADKVRKNAITAPKIEALAVKQGKLANGAVSTEKLANGAVIGSKLPNEVIGTEKLANEAATGQKVNEASLSQVPSAASADRAGFADSANPEAFAKVSAEGTVFPGDSKGIDAADVTLGKIFAGVYCISPPFAPKGAQVTPIYAGHSSVSAFVSFGGTESCSASQVEVQTYSAGAHQKEPFFLVPYR